MNLTMATLEYKSDTSMDEALEIDMRIFKAIKAHRLQSLGQPGLETIIDRLNLEPFYEFLREFNCSNDLPYHNFYHAICVFLNSYEGAWLSKLGDEETRGLCAGALLHDFNHSGGNLPDSENIKAALHGLKLAQAYAQSKLLGLSPISLDVAEAVISVTQYPFERRPLMLAERIIRDADLMQSYEEMSITLIQQYLGLKEEMEVQKKTTFTLKEFVESINEFHDNQIDWYTEWALEKAKARNWDLIKSDMCSLLSSLESA